jgi:hypothetical protein
VGALSANYRLTRPFDKTPLSAPLCESAAHTRHYARIRWRNMKTATSLL